MYPSFPTIFFSRTNMCDYSSHDHDSPSVKSSTSFMTHPEYFPATPPLPTSRRSSSASDTTSSSGGSYTSVSTPVIQEYNLSPTSPGESKSSPSIEDLAIAASTVPRSHENGRCISPGYKLPVSSFSYASRRSHSFDGNGKVYTSTTNVYAAATPTYSQHHYLPSEPYPYSRQRAQSSPMGYQAPGYAPQHNGYYNSSSVNSSHGPVVFRAGTQATYSSPPSAQDRRKAHILSEQKRRESINGGFDELKQRLTSEPITRALSSSSHTSVDQDSDCKVPFDSNNFLGGGSRDSKAATLRKAVKALNILAEKVIEQESQLAMYREQSGGSTPCKKNRHSKRPSREIMPAVDLTLPDDEMKLEDGCS
jgi:hypothetical protein